VIVWHVPPREEQPIFLYFHGNGGSLRWRDERFRALISDGSGLIALSYRGYGGSTGRPTEKTAATAARPDGQPRRAFSPMLLRLMRSPSPVTPPSASSYGANPLVQQSQSHWRQTSRSGDSCLRLRSPQRPMSARGIIGSCRCGFS
jgi:hypothetical protein